MRWGNLFDHLESNILDDSVAGKIPAISTIRASSPFLTTLVEAKRRRLTVAVGLVTGDVVHMAPKSVGREWFTGEVGGEEGSGLLIPIQSVAWLTAVADSNDSIASPGAGAVALAEVLVDLARRKVFVVCELRGGELSGFLTAVGSSWFDLVGPGGGAHERRRVNVSAVVVIRYGHRTWG